MLLGVLLVMIIVKDYCYIFRGEYCSRDEQSSNEIAAIELIGINGVCTTREIKSVTSGCSSWHANWKALMFLANDIEKKVAIIWTINTVKVWSLLSLRTDVI
jgi:hypothetical protein